MLSTIMWNSTTNPTGGSWDTGSNWVGGQIPGSTDGAVIDLAGSGTVTLGTGATDAVQSLTTNSNTTINVSSDTLSLTTISSIAGALTIERWDAYRCRDPHGRRSSDLDRRNDVGFWDDQRRRWS